MLTIEFPNIYCRIPPFCASLCTPIVWPARSNLLPSVFHALTTPNFRDIFLRKLKPTKLEPITHTKHACTRTFLLVPSQESFHRSKFQILFSYGFCTNSLYTCIHSSFSPLRVDVSFFIFCVLLVSIKMNDICTFGIWPRVHGKKDKVIHTHQSGTLYNTAQHITQVPVCFLCNSFSNTVHLFWKQRYSGIPHLQ